MKLIKDNNKAVNVGKKTNKPACPPEVRHDLIEKEAYSNACSRSFDEPDMLTDWLVAEKTIDNALTH